MMSHRFLLPLLAVALLPSCVVWNTGERIREDKLTHKGVDATRPVGGVLYETPADAGHYYVLAPEVTYHDRTPLVQIPILDVGSETQAVDVKETGERHWLRMNAPQQTKKTPRTGLVVQALPAGLGVAKVLTEPQPAATAKELVLLEDIPEPGYESANWLSLPCRYILDPVLSVASTAVLVPGVAVGGTVYGLWTMLTSPLTKAAKSVMPETPTAEPMPEAPVVMP